MSDVDLMRQVKALQAQVDSLVKPEVLRWVSWTPTVTQSGSVTVTIAYARYATTGKTAIVQARLSVTGSGTAGNNIVIGGQPTAMQAANTGDVMYVIGTMTIFDTSASLRYVGAMGAISATDWRGYAHGLSGNFGITPNFGLASGDLIGLQAVFERV